MTILCSDAVAMCVGAMLLVAVTVAEAQGTTLPKPSRTVYKCAVAGKVVYTDDPCVGAQLVNVEPTRGLNKSTGRELTGADVRREKQNEVFAEALKPITGKTPKQMEVQRNRVFISAQAQAECANLDSEIARNEAHEKAVSIALRAPVQHELFVLRARHRELRC